MKITVNGENREYAAPMTVVGLLHALGIKPESVVVERNSKIVDRSGFGQEPVEEGDTIEIIRLVGGG